MALPGFVPHAGQGIMQYGFYWLLRFSSIRFPSFAERLREKDFSFEMRVKDGSERRFYTVTGGKVRSCLWGGGEPTFSLVWATAEDGNRTMTEIMTAKPKALMKAVIAGKLFLEGDASMVGWFLETLNAMNRLYRKKPEKPRSAA